METVHLQTLLSKIGDITKKYDQLSNVTGSNFNIFEIADISSDEVKICRLLYELLSPTGRHGQGNAYLALFMREALDIPECYADDSVRVHREYVIPHSNRRIDLVIERENLFLPIEVKILSGDQQNQCRDYYLFAKERMGKEATVYYLTPDGRTPSNESIGPEKFPIKCLSFRHDIIRWLTECVQMENTLKIAPIREILLQFIASVRCFTNQLEDRPMNEIANLLMESSENMRAALAVKNILDECRARMIQKFFMAVKEKMELEAAKEQFLFETIQATQDFFDRSPLEQMKYLRDATYPHIFWKVKEIDNSTGIAFGIEFSLASLYIGFGTLENGYIVKNEGKKNREKCRYLIVDFDKMNHTEWWLAWQNIKVDGATIDSRGNENYLKLFDEEGFDRMVEKTVDQSLNVLHKLKR